MGLFACADYIVQSPLHDVDELAQHRLLGKLDSRQNVIAYAGTVDLYLNTLTRGVIAMPTVMPLFTPSRRN
jgi:hypothetical protein